MITKTSSPIADHVRINFELPASVWADTVVLVGDFNNWDPTATPLSQDRDGVWRVALDLPAGESYEFRYLVDGFWRTDRHADGLSENIYGSQNSVVEATLPHNMPGWFPADAEVHEDQPVRPGEEWIMSV